MGETQDYDKSATPAAHKTSHQDAGSDEIAVTGLSGLLADGQTPLAHKTSHQDTGTDEISVEGLAGELTAEQKSAWAKVSGKPTTFAPEAHKTSHQDGGTDEISVTGLAGTLADDQHIIDAEAVSAMGAKANSNPLNHDRYADSEALAAAVQAGAITDGVTKAPTHDAVYDVKVMTEAHKARHQDGGADEISLQGIIGEWIPNYIDGLELANNASDTAHDIDIATGFAMDSTNIYALTLSAILTKRIDAAWAAGTNQGGLDTGNVAANTWYHIYLIRKDSDGSIDALFTATYGSPTMPAGYTAKRRIGAVATSGASDINLFIQHRDKFYWSAPPLDVDDADLDTTGETYTLANLPVGYKVLAFLHIELYLASATPYIYVRSPDVGNAAPSITAAPLSTLRCHAAVRAVAQIQVLTNTSAQIFAIPSANNCEFKVAVLGWEEKRV